MKKLTVFVLSLVMLFALGCTACADKFVESPSVNTPEFVGSYNNLFLVPYRDRANLDQARRSKLEEAYDAIKNATSVSQLESSLTAPELAVSDLFELYAVNRTDLVDLKLTDGNALNNFVCLLHYVGQGQWEKVSGVSYDSVNKCLTMEDYDTTTGSPYAVVVRRSTVPTGDSFPWMYVGLAVVCVGGAIVLGKKRKHLA